MVASNLEAEHADVALEPATRLFMPSRCRVSARFGETSANAGRASSAGDGRIGEIAGRHQFARLSALKDNSSSVPALQQRMR